MSMSRRGGAGRVVVVALSVLPAAVIFTARREAYCCWRQSGLLLRGVSLTGMRMAAAAAAACLWGQAYAGAVRLTVVRREAYC